MPKSVDKPLKPLKWTEPQEQALALAFEGRWSQAEIAKNCKVSARTYAYWLAHPDFQAALEVKRADFAATLRDVAYADKAQRVIGLSQMAEAARREFEARPLLKEMRPTPDGMLVQEAFNRDAHAAFRDSLDDIAKELGERASNVKLSGGVALGIVPAGELAALAHDMLDAVRDLPEAREALGLRLLTSGE